MLISLVPFSSQGFSDSPNCPISSLRSLDPGAIEGGFYDRRTDSVSVYVPANFSKFLLERPVCVRSLRLPAWVSTDIVRQIITAYDKSLHSKLHISNFPGHNTSRRTYNPNASCPGQSRVSRTFICTTVTAVMGAPLSTNSVIANGVSVTNVNKTVIIAPGELQLS